MNRIPRSSWMLLFCAYWCLIIADASAQITPTESDVPYADHPDCVMDLFLPEDGQIGGLLVFVHGGKWILGDEDNLWIESQSLLSWFLDH